MADMDVFFVVREISIAGHEPYLRDSADYSHPTIERPATHGDLELTSVYGRYQVSEWSTTYRFKCSWVHCGGRRRSWPYRHEILVRASS